VTDSVIPISDDQAKAIAEGAKLGQDVVKAVSGAARYVARTVGTVPDDVIGIAGGDWLHEQRKRNRAKMEARTARLLEGIAPDRLTPPSPNVLLPLMEAAKDESREALQDMWAALLANLVIDGGRKVRRDYFEAVRQMEPQDAVIFQALLRVPQPCDDARQWLLHEGAKDRVNDNEGDISIQKLTALGCASAVQFHPHIVRLTPFGKGLGAALNVE
jgi:hypothetical protein